VLKIINKSKANTKGFILRHLPHADKTSLPVTSKPNEFDRQLEININVYVIPSKG